MEKYQHLLNDTNIYPQEFINNFCSCLEMWYTSTDREKELTAAKLMVCVMLANMEKIEPEIMQLDEDKTSAKRDHKEAFGEAKKTSNPLSKKKKRDSDSEDEVEDSETSSSTDTSSWEETGAFSKDRSDDKEYRFHLISSMANWETKTIEICREWGIPITGTKWEMVDKVERKFMRVVISTDFEYQLKRFQIDSKLIHLNAALLNVNPSNCNLTWYDHEGNIKSEPKVRGFVLRRKIAMDNLKIIETEIQNVKDLVPYILCDAEFNRGLLKWTNDWEREI